MKSDETGYQSIKSEVVNRYFEVKAVEAVQEGEEEFLAALEAAYRLWTDRKQLDANLAKSILRWEDETKFLNDSYDAPAHGEEPREPRLRYWTSGFRAYLAMSHTKAVRNFWVFTVLMAVQAPMALGSEDAMGLLVTGIPWLLFLTTAIRTRKENR